MQCGAKCFLVTIEKNNGEIEEVKINARNQVLARKVTRSEVKELSKILKVKESN
jgi:heterodisulfide reductase subunit B